MRMRAAAALLALLCHAHTAEAQLNAADYGAVGDGQADDAPALQRAIDAAQKQGAALSLSNGSYALGTMLSVGGEPLRLVGGGITTTRIFAAKPMDAVLNFSVCCGRVPKPSASHSLSHVTIDAAHLANHSIFAPGITRSTFTAVSAEHSLLSGASLGYGWSNTLRDCKFMFNDGAGLELYNSPNNIQVLSSSFEGNKGPALQVFGGAQVNIEGNLFESNGGPAVLAGGTKALSVTSNYMQLNAVKFSMAPDPDVVAMGSKAPVLAVVSHVVLTGMPNTNQYGNAYLNYGVRISGNFMAQAVSGAVFASGASGLTLEGNVADPDSNSVLLRTGTDRWLFNVSHVHMQGNAGWDHRRADAPASAPSSNHGLVIADSAKYAGAAHDGGRFHTFSFAECAAGITVPRNLVETPPDTWPVTNGGSIVKPDGAATYFDGWPTYNFSCGGDECTATAASIHLEREPGFAGQLVYAVLQASVQHHPTVDGISLVIDTGSGWKANADRAAGGDSWALYTFEATLDWAGTAKFGVRLHGKGPLRAEIGRLVVAPAGAEWGRIAQRGSASP